MNLAIPCQSNCAFQIVNNFLPALLEKQAMTFAIFGHLPGRGIYCTYEKSLTTEYFSAANSRRELRFQMEIFPGQFTLLFAVMILHLYKLNRLISLPISRLPVSKVFHLIMPN